ncbi:MAG: glycosyltransferase family 4 protein [Candidatus Brocadiia bacterium]
MRVCLTHYAFHPTTGGVESHLLDLGAELARQGHTVHALVGSLEGQPTESTIHGIQVHRTELMNAEWLRKRKAERGLAPEELDPQLFVAVKRMYLDFVAAYAIDVVHGHNIHHFVPEHAMALTELWAGGTPNLLTVHEVWAEALCDELLRGAKWDTVIALCDHVARTLREQTRGIENLHVVRPGIDLALFSPENSVRKWADRLGLHGREVIFHPARMLPWKGIGDSLKALEIVLRDFPDAVLVISDSGQVFDWIGELTGYADEVRQTVRDMGLEDHVAIQAFPFAEMPWVYNAAHVVVYPTVGEEPFGLAPLEAMACAKPVVATRSGGMVETVVDGETGYLVPRRSPKALAERILPLLHDKGLACHLGRRGRERAERLYSRERMARETAALYRAAVAARVFAAPPQAEARQPISPQAAEAPPRPPGMEPPAAPGA